MRKLKIMCLSSGRVVTPKWFQKSSKIAACKSPDLSLSMVPINSSVATLFTPKINLRVTAMGFTIVNALDPHSRISRSAKLGIGIAVMPGACVNADSTISDFAIVNTNASIDHDCSIGTATHIAPGATLSGNVKVGSFTLIGTGSSVRDNMRIGSNTIVGVGSAVVCDIPNDVIAVGTPARFSKK